VPSKARWSTQIELRGPGGEPVDLARTLLSHGVADLPPNAIAEDGSRMETVLPAGGRAWLVEIVPGPRGHAHVRTPDGAAGPDRDDRAALLAQVRHMLRLDEDLGAFYLAAAGDPALAWAAAGAGRLLRSPTVFEDVVKTICTTNCAWSGTVRMVGALVGELGTPATGAPDRRAFPAPAALAQADDSFYRDVARAGYRGPYLRTLATDIAEGRLDLEAFNDPALPDEEVAERLLALAGVGPYAMAHVMMLLGRYRRLVLDSWTRPKYRRLVGRPRVTDKGIQRAFRRYREFAGLAFWLTLTEDWLAQDDPAAAADRSRLASVGDDGSPAQRRDGPCLRLPCGVR
jgi:3-methyladenine DNA glycosylase/8-oxoguanine DNA glycosylase